jgi:hypothetical protein
VRPALLPAHRPLWRDAATLQLGRCGARAAVVRGLDPALRRCCGCSTGRTTGRRSWPRRLRRRATRPGRRPARPAADAGLLCDGGRTARRCSGLRHEERERLAATWPRWRWSAGRRAGGGGPAPSRRRPRRRRRPDRRAGGRRAGGGSVGDVDVVDDDVTRPQDTGVGGLSLADVGRPARPGRARAAAPHAPSLPRLPLVAPTSWCSPRPRRRPRAGPPAGARRHAPPAGRGAGRDRDRRTARAARPHPVPALHRAHPQRPRPVLAGPVHQLPGGR